MTEESYQEDRRRNLEYEEYSRYRRNRIVTLYGALLILIGAIIIALKDLLLNFLATTQSIAVIGFGTGALIIGVGLILYRYLQFGGILGTIGQGGSDRSIRLELDSLRLELRKLRKKNDENADAEDLSETVNRIIDQTLTEDFIHSKIDSVYSEQAIEKSKLNKIYEDFENLDYRIGAEIGRLRRSANLNLVIGTLTTILAIVALGYEVFTVELEFTDTVKLLSHYLPRLSIIIFIEIFAFFFLKLYKATLEDIKYFNNEKTNIDFKLISLRTAIHQNEPELIKVTIEELVKTERNFKLAKGESTASLEHLRTENENNKLLSQILSKLTDKL